MGIDTSKIMIFLLDECNLHCAHCVRDDEPMYPGYSLTHDQFNKCMDDCLGLGTVRSIHFSGGEPTLWNEKTYDLVDLLIQISNMGFDPGFTSNGRYFENKKNCVQFFERYFSHSERPLHVFFSIDSFHENFDREKGKSKSLDNVLDDRNRNNHISGNQLLISVITVISKEEESLLPDHMIQRYQSLGVGINFIPLESKGRARSLSSMCPDLVSNDPADLGAFYRYFELESLEKQVDNKSIILIGDQYYLYLNDFRCEFTLRWRILCPLGRLQHAIVKQGNGSGYTCHLNKKIG